MKDKLLSAKKIIFQSIKDFSASSKQGFQYALFFALSITFLFNPIDPKNVSVEKFTSAFGLGTMMNWDCSRVISNFYAWILLFSFLLFGLWIFFNTWKKNAHHTEEEKKAVDFLDGITTLGCAILFIKSFVFFLMGKLIFFTYSAVFLNFAVIFGFLYLIFGCSKKVSFDFYQSLCFAVFLFSFCVMAVTKKTSIDIVILLFTIDTIACVSFVKFFKGFEKNVFISTFVKANAVALSFFTVGSSIFFEALNVLNAREVFITNAQKYYALFFFILLCCAELFSFVAYRKKLDLAAWKHIAYPVFLIGFVGLCSQPFLTSIYPSDIFESANLSIPVSNFLNFGKLPIITCYPGHMMTGVWQAFLYAFFTGDNWGAILSPYYTWLEFSVTGLLFFYTIKIVLNDDLAFFTTLLFPFAYPTGWYYFAPGILLTLTVIAYVKKQTVPRLFAIWITFVFVALYRLDIGFSFLGASLPSLALWIFQTKKYSAIKQLLFSFGITVFLSLIVWVVLCVVQDVNPVSRLIEFLKLSASNSSWSRNEIGDTSRKLFSIVYLIMPFLMSLVLGLCLFSKDKVASFDFGYRILFFTLGFAYFFNLPRTLVRHTLSEPYPALVLFWTSPFFLSMAVHVFFPKKKLFLPFLALFAITIGHLMDESPLEISKSVISEQVLQKIRRTLNEDRTYKRQRVTLEPVMQDWCNEYKVAMDTLLADDETFIDFMNRSFVYSVIGRESPVYATQSPIMLSGEFTQRMFIKEIKDKIEKVPVAILPLTDNHVAAEHDGVLNSYRYYKVSEFIFTHYRPLCKFGDFAIWALNDRYDELNEKLQLSGKLIPIDVRYTSNFHDYSLNYLPLLWAEKNAKNVLKNKQLASLNSDDGVYRFDSTKIDKANGNYIHLKVYNPEQDKKISLQLGTAADDEFVNNITFSFTAVKGLHDYVIRVSADYLWYFENNNVLKIDGDLEVSDVQILEGES